MTSKILDYKIFDDISLDFNFKIVRLVSFRRQFISLSISALGKMNAAEGQSAETVLRADVCVALRLITKTSASLASVRLEPELHFHNWIIGLIDLPVGEREQRIYTCR